MTIDKIINELKKYSCNIKKGKRLLLNNCELHYKDYSCGVIFNELNKRFEIYSYVINDNTQSIASSLLLKSFDSKIQADKYFKYLCNMLKSNDIEYLLDVCKEYNKTDFGQNENFI